MATKKSSANLKGQIPLRIKGHTKCPYHKRNEVVFLCRECSVLICTTCSITTHKTHIDSFSEVSKIKDEQRNTLHDYLNTTENIEIPKLKNEILSARKEISTSESHYKTLSENIKTQRDQCKQELDKVTEDYLTTCDKMEKVTTDLLKSHIANLEDRLDTLVKLSSECKQTLQAGTAVLVYDSVSEIQDLDLDIPQTPNIDMTEFTPGTDIRNHLEQALGKMKTSTNSNQGPTVIAQFSYKDVITLICPTPDGRAWLCNYNTNTVNLINNTGQVLQKIQHISNIQHISLDPTTGRLWFCSWNDRTIYEVFTSYTPVRRFTTEGYPVSLCVTRQGRVVVGTQGRQGYKVVMYTEDGQVLHTATVEKSVTGHVLSITQCGVTGNIAVVSSKLIGGNISDPNNYRRHIIVYNPTLQPLFHYRGEGIQARELVTPFKFNPFTVVYDSKGNIVIADRKRNTIELIRGSGKYIKTLHTNKGGQGHVGIGIQKDDVLWSHIQFDTGELGLKVLKYYSD